MKINFLTTNKFKIATARLALLPLGFTVAPISLSIPEIQADSNVEIARHSALIAAKQLGEPVMREDHGFVLHAFPGWPGPYMAHTERLIPPKDVLQLLQGKDRTGYFTMALAYATPDDEVIEFSYQLPCTVTENTHPGSQNYCWDSIICLGNEKQALSEYPPENRYPFFTQNFRRLAEKLQMIV